MHASGGAPHVQTNLCFSGKEERKRKEKNNRDPGTQLGAKITAEIT